MAYWKFTDHCFENTYKKKVQIVVLLFPHSALLYLFNDCLTISKFQACHKLTILCHKHLL